MKKIFPGKELILKENHPTSQFPRGLTILYAVLEENGEIILFCQCPGIGDIICVFGYGIYHITPEIQEFIDKVKAAHVPPKKCGDLTLDDLQELCVLSYYSSDTFDVMDDVKEWAKERNIQLPS